MTTPPEHRPFDWSKVITPEAIAYAKASRERENPRDLKDSAVIHTADGPAFLLGPRGQAVAAEILARMRW